MRKRTTTVSLLAAMAVLALADAASAYYSPRLGRFLNRDPVSEPGAAVVRQVGRQSVSFVPRDPLRVAAEANEYEFVENAPTDKLDLLGLQTCKRDLFPDVTVEQYTGGIAHQWLNISGSRRGFYPVGPLFGGPGQWVDESTLPAEFPVGQYRDPVTGRTHIVYAPKVQWALANDYVNTWNTRRRCTGGLTFGRAKGTACSCATGDQILDCLLTATQPGVGGTYSLIGGNCIDRSEDALSQCCLRKNKQTHRGKRWPGSGGTSGSS